MSTDIRRNRNRLSAALILLASVAVLALVACGSGESGTEFERIQDTGVLVTTDTLQSTGFRESKSYSVTDLPGAEAAVFGFWRPPGRDPLDFEARFYASHEDAVQLGTELAEEGTGDDAVLDAESATFKEGVQDRRTIIGSGAGGGARSGIGPKYADFVIYNNVIILCPGGQAEQSHERCADLIEAMEMQ